MKLPQTIPLVKKSKTRPMGLKFRVMSGGNPTTLSAFEAIPWFTVKADKFEDMNEVAPRLERTELIAFPCRER